ncbi:MAG TPA: hypothetical protein VFP93_03575, partial [Gammaproteobacteria bacterium]|nr:hypothetical protein [Gammaproteobacteria bacterium]
MAMRGPIQNILSAKARFNAVAVNPEQLGIRLDEIQSFIADFLYRFKNDEKALLIHYKNNDKFKALRQDFIQKLNKLSIEYKNSHVDWYSSYNQPHMALEGKL